MNVRIKNYHSVKRKKTTGRYPDKKFSGKKLLTGIFILIPVALIFSVALFRVSFTGRRDKLNERSATLEREIGMLGREIANLRMKVEEHRSGRFLSRQINRFGLKLTLALPQQRTHIHFNNPAETTAKNRRKSNNSYQLAAGP